MDDEILDQMEGQTELPEAVKNTIKALRTEVKALKKGNQAYSDLESKYNNLLAKSALRESLIKAGIKSEAIEVVLPYIKEKYQLETVGDGVEIKTDDGHQPLDTVMTQLRDSSLMSGFFNPVNSNSGSGSPTGASENVRQLSRTEEAKRLWNESMKQGHSPQMALDTIAKAGLSDVKF